MSAPPQHSRARGPARPAIEHSGTPPDHGRAWSQAVARLASLPIEQLDHRWWADELLLAVRAVLPAVSGSVRLLVDEETWVSLTSFGAYRDVGHTCADPQVPLRQRYLAADGQPLVIAEAATPQPVGGREATTRPESLVGLPLLVEGELLGAAEVWLSPTCAQTDADVDRLTEAQRLVDVAAAVLVNLEAYRRERSAGELLQQLLDRRYAGRSRSG